MKCGSIADAQKLFDEMGERDLCSWKTMIFCYERVGKLKQARKLFNEMPQRENFAWTNDIVVHSP